MVMTKAIDLTSDTKVEILTTTTLNIQISSTARSLVEPNLYVALHLRKTSHLLNQDLKHLGLVTLLRFVTMVREEVLKATDLIYHLR